jgi:alkyl hydroperoxide reductase subunit AhpC
VLQTGDFAPDFEVPALIAGVRKLFRLSEWLRDGCVLLAFYPHNWNPLTAEQLISCQTRRMEFVELGVETVAITVDSMLNIVAWEREIGPLDFPMLADFWPHGAVSEKYGVLRPVEPFRGASERALFYISKAGRIEFSKRFGLDEGSQASETLRIVRQLMA